MPRLLLWLALSQTIAALEISRLRIEYLDRPLGLHETRPRFSWVLDSDRRGAGQTAYQIEVQSAGETLWDSGKVDSSRTNHVVYRGRPLESGTQCSWRVRVWDEHGKAFESESSSWSMGLLHEEDWNADWVGLPRPEPETGEFPTEGSAIRSEQAGDVTFSKAFVIDEVKQGAELMVVGSHSFILHLNDRHIITGTANEGQRLPVSGYLKPGENRIKATAKGTTSGFELKAVLQNGSQRVTADTFRGGAPLPDADLSDVWTDESRRLPARHLRREFALAKSVERAVLHLATGGLHEVWINGERVSDDVLAPGMTDFQHRIPTVTYEVGAHLQPGSNAIGILLGNGRFHAPRLHVPTKTLDFGAPIMRARLVVTHHDGGQTILTSGPEWKASDDGPIRANNEYDGEEHDARLEMPGWTEPGFDESTWKPAELMPKPEGACRSLQREPIRILGERRAVEIVETRPGVWRFDFGANLTGRAALRVSGERGSRVTLRHSQRLAADGSLDEGNLRSALATDRYTLRGDPDGETWEPRFVFHGFRWIEVSGLDKPPGPETLLAKEIGNDLTECGTFDSSDPTLNRIMALCRNTLRSNYVSVPLDCADRDERQGWQGDRAAESWSEASLFDIAALYTRWLEEVRDSQKPDGVVSDVAPALWPFHSGSAVWPTIQTMAPRTLFLKYGDRRIMERHYEGNRAWVRFQLGRLKQNGLLGADVYGDWCPPPSDRSLVNAIDPSRNTDKAFVANAYLALQLKLMAETAESLGKETRPWTDALADLRKAIEREWWKGDHFANRTQTTFALAHSIGLVPEGRRAAFADALKARLLDDRHRVGTGNIGIQWLHTTIDDLCGPEAALRMATQREYPGYGYMLDQGATTMWELWNGDTAASTMSSANHIMMIGDFPRWCFEYLAGIQARMDGPGYARITMKPTFPDGLESVSVSHDTIRGRVESRWHSKADGLIWEVRIPTNSEAELHFPVDGGRQVFESGEVLDLSKARNEGDRKVRWFPSGTYRFELR